MTRATMAEIDRYVRPGDWVADPAASTLTFAVRNFRWRTVTGRIPLTSAAVHVSQDGDPVSARAELAAHGIDTGHRRRDQDLRGRRFLAADQWPAMTFEAEDIQPNEAAWTVNGTLTVKGTRCPVRLDVASFTLPADDPAAHLDLHATGYLDRRSAGVTAAPAFVVGHRVTLSLRVRLRPPATAQAATAPAQIGRAS
jgi:polyisoprenoid-binding protein YceI